MKSIQFLNAKIKNAIYYDTKWVLNSFVENFMQNSLFFSDFCVNTHTHTHTHTHTIPSSTRPPSNNCIVSDNQKLKFAKIHIFVDLLICLFGYLLVICTFGYLCFCLNHDFNKIFKMNKINIFSTETLRTQSCTEKIILNHSIHINHSSDKIVQTKSSDKREINLHTEENKFIYGEK